MTQETKIILRELAIIHTALKVLMEQQETITERLLGTVEMEKFPKAYSDAELAQTIALMKKRLQKQGIQEDF